MLRFSIRDLLLSTTLIASGLGSLVAIRSPEWWWLCFWSLPLLCAGIFHLFNRLWLGTGIGCLLELLIAVGLFVWLLFLGSGMRTRR
jgi:hypothetical protein